MRRVYDIRPAIAFIVLSMTTHVLIFSRLEPVARSCVCAEGGPGEGRGSSSSCQSGRGSRERGSGSGCSGGDSCRAGSTCTSTSCAAGAGGEGGEGGSTSTSAAAEEAAEEAGQEGGRAGGGSGGRRTEDCREERSRTQRLASIVDLLLDVAARREPFFSSRAAREEIALALHFSVNHLEIQDALAVVLPFFPVKKVGSVSSSVEWLDLRGILKRGRENVQVKEYKFRLTGCFIFWKERQRAIRRCLSAR